MKKIINGLFPLSRLGGSPLSPSVKKAMDIDGCRDMEELDQWAGEQISKVTKAESATVSSGAYAGLVQSAAALINGVRDQFTVQKLLRTRYDSALEVAGGKIVQDSMDGYYAAGIHYLAGGEGPWWVGTQPWMLWRVNPTPLPDIQTYASRHGVPVLVDAAGQTYPLDGFTRYNDCDLTVYAGKYFGAPMSTGFVSGKKELIDRVRQQGPIGFEKGFRGVGRGYKVDACEVYGMVAALWEWVHMGHWTKRAWPAYKRIQVLREMLPDLEIEAVPEEKEQLIPYHRICALVTVPDAEAVQKRLEQGDPSIRVDTRLGKLFINTLTLLEGEVVTVAEQIKKLI